MRVIDDELLLDYSSICSFSMSTNTRYADHQKQSCEGYIDLPQTHVSSLVVSSVTYWAYTGVGTYVAIASGH